MKPESIRHRSHMHVKGTTYFGTGPNLGNIYAKPTTETRNLHHIRPRDNLHTRLMYNTITTPQITYNQAEQQGGGLGLDFDIDFGEEGQIDWGMQYQKSRSKSESEPESRSGTGYSTQKRCIWRITVRKQRPSKKRIRLDSRLDRTVVSLHRFLVVPIQPVRRSQ